MGHDKFSRRRFLYGSGAVITLPWMESLLPRALAQAAPPLRFVQLYFPNGTYKNTWKPVTTGTAYTMPAVLSALGPYKNRITIGKNLRQNNGNIDGAGDHARAAGTFGTNVRINKSEQDVRAGTSADQKMAAWIKARHPGHEAVVMSYAGNGGGDSGYSQLYTSNISWLSATVPATRLTSPTVIFDRLFTSAQTGTDAQVAYNRLKKKSILDGVLAQSGELSKSLGSSDKQKLDQYLTSIREIERKLAAESPAPVLAQCASPNRPSDAGLSFPDHMTMMMDLAVLALSCDRTRVLSYMLDFEGAWRSFSFAGINAGHHEVSHYATNESVYGPQYEAITKWYAGRFAYFLSKMTAVKEGAGDLLSNTMLVFGSGIEDGNAHNDNLTLIIAGEAGGRWQPGRAVDFAQAPVANLWLTCMRTMGLPDASHGDSTGTFDL